VYEAHTKPGVSVGLAGLGYKPSLDCQLGITESGASFEESAQRDRFSSRLAGLLEG